jgi:nucleotide-binding universal stress UspA family protein
MNANRLIVVGVDGSEGSRRALHWAVHEAHLHGGTVQAVSSWRADAEETGAEGGEPSARDSLAHEIEALPAFQRSGVSIATEVVEGRAADVLTAAARDADLLVLGSHGHSRTWHTVLGSVTEECVRHATCPVVVIPKGYEQRPTTGPAAQTARQ